jgi:hypothetical protein
MTYVPLMLLKQAINLEKRTIVILMNAAIYLDGSTHNEEADDVTIDEEHNPPSDVGNFFSAPIQPAKGKYMDLIRLLLKMNVTAADRPSYCNKDFTTELCEDVMDVLNEEPSLLDINITAPPPVPPPATAPPKGTTIPPLTAVSPLVVVGDIHGQFHDMVTHVFSQQYDRPVGVAIFVYGRLRRSRPARRGGAHVVVCS